MKKLLMMIALLAFPAFVMTGCGDSGTQAIEATSESDGTEMTADQQAQYEEQMQGGSSSAPN